MRCPKFNCSTERVRTLATRNEEELPPRLKQYNIKRRRRICHYGHKFFTIELCEDDFDKLVAERGRLEPIMPGVRGGKQS